MADEGRLSQGRAAPQAKPSAAEISAAKAATGAYGDRFGTGAADGANQLVGGTPSSGCGAASPTGTPSNTGAIGETSSSSGFAPGSGSTQGVSSAVQQNVLKSVPSGCQARVSPNGGKAYRDKPGSAHFNGLALDTYLVCGGQVQYAGSAKMNEYIYNLNANGARGLSYYDSGFVHADWKGQSQRRWGNNQGYVNSATRGENPGPGAANQAGGSSPGGGGDPCAGGGGGSGCQPINSSAPQIAAGLSQNLGLDVPSIVQGLAGVLTGGSPLAAAMAGITSAAQNFLGGALPLSPAALADPTSAITQAVSDKIAGMGASILPSVVGNMPPELVSATGIVQGQVSDKITSTANQIFSKSSPPKLERFISVFNAALAAQNYANSLQFTMKNTVNNVFGNARYLWTDLDLNNWANVSGLPNDENAWIELDGPTIGEVRSAIDLTIQPAQWLGDPDVVLRDIVSRDNINAFSSLFYDWDAYVTRGFGTITNNVIALGSDLQALGKLADLNDMLRIGTAGQIAQQIIINGAGASCGLLQYMQQEKLNIRDLSDPIYDNQIAEFLESVIDPDAIDVVIQALEIDPTLTPPTLGSLLDPQWIFPQSYDYNYFNKLNDIAVFLSMLFVNSRGYMTTLSDLGNLLVSFEVPYDTSLITGDPATYDYRQMSELGEKYAPVGFFTEDGSLSVADFIGTAAGYIHEVTIPRIAEIQAELYNDTTYFDDYADLLALLEDTLNGVYTVPGIFPSPNTVQPPTTAGYSFGIYNTLDDAVSDIVDAIEDELEYAKSTIESDNDLTVTSLMLELDSLHTESAMLLAREHKLRKEYGFQLGPAKKTDQFIGDGTTQVLPLSVDIDDTDDLDVFISGVWQAPTNYTVNTTANTITLPAAPAFNTRIAVVYRTGYFDGRAEKMQVWEFASSLENLARETGSGRAADYLRKITTNDVYGQRIQAALMLSRNKARARAAGINSSNFETNDGVGPTYTNYTSWTGIWAENAERAAELYVQVNSEVETYYQYLIKKYSQNVEALKPDIDLLMQNCIRQLLFTLDGQVIMSDMMVEKYNNNPIEFLYETDRLDLALNFDEENVPSDGIVLGNETEIISQLMRIEGLQNTVYTEELSGLTKEYLATTNIQLEVVVALAQRIMLATLATNFGITETDAKTLFGVQSVSKSLLTNTANGY